MNCARCGMPVKLRLGLYLGHSNYADSNGQCPDCGLRARVDQAGNATWYDVIDYSEFWSPTADNVNALPLHIREYIHDLETNADPAGMVAENTLISDLCRQLDAKIAQLKERLL